MSRDYDHTDPDAVLDWTIHGHCTWDDAPDPGPDDEGNEEARRLAGPAWEKWEAAARAALVSLLGDDKTDEIIDGEGPSWLWDVWATVAGEGVGVWDGRWETWLTGTGHNDDELSKALRESLGGVFGDVRMDLYDAAMTVWCDLDEEG